MPFSSYFKDNFIAPEISTFKGVELEDLSCYDDQSPHWLYNYILNMGFSYQIKPYYREVIFNFLRRVHGAFEAYDLARKELLEYSRFGSGYNPRSYFRALNWIEVCVSFSDQAFRLVLQTYNTEERLFKAGEGSPLERLRELYNKTKHIDGILNENGKTGLGRTLVVYLTTDGILLKSRKEGHLLKYSELSELLKELADEASYLSQPSKWGSVE